MSHIESLRVLNDSIALSSTSRANVAKYWPLVQEHIIRCAVAAVVRSKQTHLKIRKPAQEKIHTRFSRSLCVRVIGSGGGLQNTGGRSTTRVLVLLEHLEPAVVSADAAICSVYSKYKENLRSNFTPIKSSNPSSIDRWSLKGDILCSPGSPNQPEKACHLRLLDFVQ